MSSFHGLHQLLGVVIFIGGYMVATTESIELVNTTACGSSKKCWRRPESCNSGSGSSDCTFVVTYAKSGRSDSSSSVIFELQGQPSLSSGQDNGLWIALGFSPKGKMTKSAVSACAGNIEESIALLHFNYGHKTRRIKHRRKEPKTIKLQEMGVLNGNLICRFQQKIIPPRDAEIFPLNRPHFLLLAAGTADERNLTDPELHFHGKFKFATKTAVNIIS